MFRGSLLRGTVVCLMVSPVCADTVYLYNGTSIDGVIRARHEASIEIQIGELGRVFIDLETIESIEKNNRDGAIQDSGLSLAAKRRQADAVASEDGEGDAVEPSSDKAEVSSTPAKRYLTKDDVGSEQRKTIEQYVYDLTRHRRQVRVRAERRLLEIGEPAVPFLLDVVGHENHLVRMAVLRIFKAVGNDSVTGAVIDRLEDDNGYVRLTAVETLRRLTGQDFGFKHNGSRAARKKAVAAWRAWHEKEKQAREAETAPESGPPPSGSTANDGETAAGSHEVPRAPAP